MTPERRRRRLARTQAMGIAGLLLVIASGRVAYSHQRYLAASVAVSVALLGSTHAFFAREVRRLEHVERALRHANRELESFSYSVSHDLRAPLRSIDGFSRALVEDAGPVLDREAHGHLDRIRKATQRMGGLIDDLLALSRVSRAEMKRERVDLTALAEQIVGDLQRRPPARHVAVAITPGLAVEGDPDLLRLALDNLLDNAWKFSGRRIDATIEVGETRDEDGDPAFFVRDNGAGFDPAYAPNLFAPFQRLHAASEFPGTGIGLATVHRIVRRHGGHVWADGEVDRGACFYFTLGCANE
jgi:signal transduction histidine kinase